MAPITESEFNRRIDDTLLALEEAVDASGADVDYDNAGGILTLHCTSGSQGIINRQTPVRQLWLAARSGGFHFDWDENGGGWRSDSDGAPLSAVLAEILASQCGAGIAFE